ncbi:hypothetical protein PACTADRAFT_32346 [Pachysolen tannophilus NRRL Y-2460]|uniref:RRM domain-containing protein n=1 Tax=Pachysolen tannophilus NRRL Y-2460 TaxID=669874 RepID=A0A1E4TYM9_PACTA|nr:hypothetical protein PACTADRAFT_32346 [Pachysolen tannophilus NRRL Y-2460]
MSHHNVRDNGGITKPRKRINNLKTSDRRLAAGRQPTQFLHSSTPSKLDIAPGVLHSNFQILKDLKKESVSGKDSNVTVVRTAADGSKKWEDPTLLEWDPKHFRIFVGNLGPDVTDELLLRAFMHYPSLKKVKVVIDPKTNKNKGYGFVAFENTDDYIRALNDMNGKYIGQRPVQLKRAKTDIKPVKKKAKK